MPTPRSRAPRLVVRLLALALLLPAGIASAAEGDYQPYQPGASGEAVSAPLFVVIAYSAIWLVLVGFVVMVWRRQREVQRELERLAHELARSGGSKA